VKGLGLNPSPIIIEFYLYNNIQKNIIIYYKIQMECPNNRFDESGSNCVISTRKANEIVKAAFKQKKARRPIFYIKYGPPASGKGSIMAKAIAKDGLTEQSLITVEVDSIIESNPGYIKQRTELMNNSDTDGKSALYWKYRGEADVISDQILNEALLGDFDIAWETTGGTIAWTIREIKRIQKQGYDVTLVYPLVPADVLVQRSLDREANTGQTPAPETQIRKGVKSAINNLSKLLDHVDNVYLYDNSGKFGEEYIVIEVNNVWDWTPEDSRDGAGLQKSVNCDCNKLNTELSARFAAEVMRVLNKICERCNISQN